MAVDAPADGSVFVEVLQGHIDFRSDGGGLEPQVIWPEVPEEASRLTRIKEQFNYYGEGRLEDMTLDLNDPSRYLLVQSSPSGDEPWYVLCELIEDVLSYIRTEEEPWNFEVLIDLDTGEEFELVTDYSFKPAKR